jgi:predicted NUDIX family NTP pyrophosphohydrolase
MRVIEVLVLRDVVGMLGVLLHAPRGPFYSPKAARSRLRAIKEG